MNIAGGISAALFHRLRTGEATEVDVSLLSTAWWASGTTLDIALDYNEAPRNRMPTSGGNRGNALMGNYWTSDRGTINMCTLGPGPHIRNFFEHIGRAELADDERFATTEAFMQNWEAASNEIKAAFAQQPLSYWREKLKTYSGQWAPVQSMFEMIEDEQALANDMIFEVEAADGGEPIKLVRGPVQFNHAPVNTTRAPVVAEHTEISLMELGIEWDKIEELKQSGAIA
jgi:crotonobetainyl-CoA:carnitine CoA-transferase CaiB-like acyl-CoA transferase